MCGIAGFIDRRAATAEPELRAAARAMADALVHRGPDDAGVWTDAAVGIALGHRRLPIIDLSAAGAQPMVSASGRFVLTYNGEAYNFGELRAELEAAGVRFRGHSDTEVILEACEAWGIEASIARLIGMFAFALWDRRERRLWLVRDRLGIKPLYWSQQGPRFLFGSELKALRAHAGWTPRIDPDALAGFMRYGYVPGPATIYRGVEKLPPGCFLVVEADGSTRLERFWDLEAVIGEARTANTSMDEAEALDRLDALLKDAVQRRMIADVPLGAFLSGGIDSSTVTALMQAQSNRPVRTFTIGFRESDYDEATHARAVARHLGTDHTELYVEPAQAMETIPRMAEIFDEPFADASQIPTFLVSEMTRRHVTVALSGDGGDELFAGYNRYFQASNLRPVLDRIPMGARRLIARGVLSVSPGSWSRIFRAVPSRWRPPQPGDKMHKLAQVLDTDPEQFYRRLVSQWTEPEALVHGGREPKDGLWDGTGALLSDVVERMQYLDTVTYLPDDLLTKVDRASMAVSLEARVPLLDHRVVAFAWSLPRALKIRNGGGKWILRRLLLRYVPKELLSRPKMGFGVPIDHWLRGPLRDWAEALLAERRIRSDGLLDAALVRARWEEHQSGKRNWQYPLWTVLMFQMWKERWL